MTRRRIQVLAAVAAALVLLMFALDTADDGGSSGDRGRLLPDLRTAANALSEIAVITADGTTTLDRMDDGWTVAERDDYPADIGKLRELVIALTEAEVVEQKTAKPANYDRLGVGDPAEEDDGGTKVTLIGAGASFAVILGDPARGEYRYARIADRAQSVLIDRNPDVPGEPADWLAPDIVDLPADEVQRVSISHADGETLVLEREAPAEEGTSPGEFTVLDIPEDRELRYAAIANPIGGALANLQLDDVRRAEPDAGEPDTTTVFATFDGTTITVTVRDEGDGDDATSWLGFSAEPDYDGLNERTGDWEYRVPDYKRSPLERRWDDLLKPEVEAGDEDAP